MISMLGGCTKTGPEDSVGATRMRFDGLHNYRYCEVFLIGGNPITKDLHANFYNTTELNLGADPVDSCPDAMWAAVDAGALKKQYDVLGVFKNGPRYWMYDWIELEVGADRNFNGLQARWYGNVKLPKEFGKEGSTAFKPTTVERKSLQGWAKGQTVFILDDPDGTPWLMQAYSNIVDPDLSYDDLATLDRKLELPPGWTYRVKVLEEDLTIHPINGVARIVQDNLQSTYNACFEENGVKACSYQP
jgi:hypothetical protein